jgi:PII-like signaling protein
MSSGGSQTALFESLCEDYAGMSGVTVPAGGTGFGSNALKINKSIFAMLVDDQIVIKLPEASRELVAEAVAFVGKLH